MLIEAILYWLPMGILIIFLVFLIVFFKTDVFRKYRIRYKIYRNRLMRFLRHLIHDLLYIVRISALLRMILYFALFILFVGFIAYVAIFFYNQYAVPLLGKYLNLAPIELSVDRIRGLLFSRQTNPIYAVGFVLGTALSAFMRPKLEKFVEKVRTKRSVIYVFGCSDITRQFVASMCEFGFGPLIALIAEREKPWMANYSAYVDLLTLDDPDILRDPTIYERIGFKNALKVLILVDDKELAQHILLNVRRNNPSVEIVLLSRNKPPLLELAEGFVENIKVIDDVDITNRELIRQISLGFMYANAVETLVPQDYVGRTPEDLESDFNGRLKVLAVKRGHSIITPREFQENDILILYLVDPRALREFLQLLPISPFEEIMSLKETKASEGESHAATRRDKAS